MVICYVHLHQRKRLQKWFGCTNMHPTDRLLLNDFYMLLGFWLRCSRREDLLMLVTQLPSGGQARGCGEGQEAEQAMIAHLCLSPFLAVPACLQLHKLTVLPTFLS